MQNYKALTVRQCQQNSTCVYIYKSDHIVTGNMISIALHNAVSQYRLTLRVRRRLQRFDLDSTAIRPRYARLTTFSTTVGTAG